MRKFAAAEVFREGGEVGFDVDWWLIGCESGPARRPCPLEWVREIVTRVDALGGAVFVKQLDIDGEKANVGLVGAIIKF